MNHKRGNKERHLSVNKPLGSLFGDLFALSHFWKRRRTCGQVMRDVFLKKTELAPHYGSKQWRRNEQAYRQAMDEYRKPNH